MALGGSNWQSDGGARGCGEGSQSWALDRRGLGGVTGHEVLVRGQGDAVDGGQRLEAELETKNGSSSGVNARLATGVRADKGRSSEDAKAGHLRGGRHA